MPKTAEKIVAQLNAQIREFDENKEKVLITRLPIT